ncbi:MAG: hypothetical protein WCK48_00355 [bacterium]
MQKIFIFGNIDLPNDSLPLRILPKLEELFPHISFEIKDPNEEWEVEENIVVIDTVVGIQDITIFDNLESFSKIPRVGMHDFDALTNLRYLKKLGKIKNVVIVGIPPKMDEKITLSKVSNLIKENSAIFR